MSHYDDIFYKEELEQRQNREKRKKELEDKFNSMTRDERIDWVVNHCIENYIHERVFGR